MSNSRTNDEGSDPNTEGMSEAAAMVAERNAKVNAAPEDAPVSVESEDALASRSREDESRESEMRSKVWKPAPLLPQPNERPGLDHRYVRVSTRGQEDDVNASQAFREGWEPVLNSEYPELMTRSDRNSGYTGNVVIGGLLLCCRPKYIGEHIANASTQESVKQMEAVDSNFFRDQDSRMPKLRSDRSSRVSQFGDD